MRIRTDIARHDVGSLPRGRQQSLVRLAKAAALLLIGAAIAWSGVTVFGAGSQSLDETDYTLATVTRGEVSSALNLNTAVAWDLQPVGTNRAAGVVTSIHIEDGEEVSAGKVLYTVDLRPVVVAMGEIPAFRSLTVGSVGTDVTQVQVFLADLGLYGGTADGRFGYETAKAVKAWQRTVGVTPDGLVQPGDFVFVPNLPARVALDRDLVTVGASLSGGESVVAALPAEPSFRVPLTESQSVLVDNSTEVVITAPDGQEWSAIVNEIVSTDEDGVQAVLGPTHDASICGETCDLISAVDKTLLPSRVVLVPATRGLVVPTAAVRTRADQATFVVDADGVEYNVRVVASARGVSAIEGVDEGLSVRVSAQSQ